MREKAVKPGRISSSTARSPQAAHPASPRDPKPPVLERSRCKTELISDEIVQCKLILDELETMLVEKQESKMVRDVEKVELRARNKVLLATLNKVNLEYLNIENFE